MKAKQRNIDRLHWYVIWEDYNRKEITTYDVFRHGTFSQQVIKAFEKYSNSYEDFKKEIISWVKYCFWSKCEYEVIVSSWPPRNDGQGEEKIDIAYQLLNNEDIFATYTWNTLHGEWGAYAPPVTKTTKKNEK